MPIGRTAEKLPGHQESSSSGKLCTADLTYLLGYLRHHSSKPSSLRREGRTLSTRRIHSLFSEDPDVIPFHLSLLTIHCTSKLQFLASNTPHFHADFLAVSAFKIVLSTPSSFKSFCSRVHSPHDQRTPPQACDNRDAVFLWETIFC